MVAKKVRKKRSLADLLAERGGGKKKEYRPGASISFRLPADEGFVEAFVLALEATGATPTDLIVESMRKGMVETVRELMKERQQGEEKWVRWHIG